MYSTKDIYFFGDARLGATLDTSYYPDSLFLRSINASTKARKFFLRRDTFLGVDIFHQAFYLGPLKGEYSCEKDDYYNADLAVGPSGVLSKYEKRGVPEVAIHPGGSVVRTIKAFSRADVGNFHVKLIAFTPSRTIPEWTTDYLVRTGVDVEWIFGTKAEPNIEFEILWNNNGHCEKIVIQHGNNDYNSTRCLPIKAGNITILNSPCHCLYELVILNSILEDRTKTGMLVYSTSTSIDDSPVPALKDTPKWLGDSFKKKMSYRDYLLKILEKSHFLYVILNKYSLAKLFPYENLYTKDGALSIRAVKKLMQRLWEMRRIGHFRRYYFISPDFWVSIDENGKTTTQPIYTTLSVPLPYWTDIVAGFIFALEAAHQDEGKFYSTDQVMKKAKALVVENLIDQENRIW